jgi:monoamine oxidase
MDMSTCKLSLKKRQAMRCLHYDFSCKLALKFKSRFWEKVKNIFGGSSSTDNPLRTVVYPSNGTVQGGEAAGVLLVSYTWAQDASRMGSLFFENGYGNFNTGEGAVSEQNKKAVDLSLKWLSEIHPDINVYEAFSGEYFFHDWYADKYCQGAFALYGPSQFTELYPHMVQPAADGLLHFAGEAISVHHAWIIGSLNSAYRSVFEILEYEGLHAAKIELVRKWNKVEEVEYGDFDVLSYLPKLVVKNVVKKVAEKVQAIKSNHNAFIQKRKILNKRG